MPPHCTYVRWYNGHRAHPVCFSCSPRSVYDAVRMLHLHKSVHYPQLQTNKKSISTSARVCIHHDKYNITRFHDIKNVTCVCVKIESNHY